MIYQYLRAKIFVLFYNNGVNMAHQFQQIGILSDTKLTYTGFETIGQNAGDGG